jgi:hypothetical protein
VDDETNGRTRSIRALRIVFFCFLLRRASLLVVLRSECVEPYKRANGKWASLPEEQFGRVLPEFVDTANYLGAKGARLLVAEGGGERGRE